MISFGNQKIYKQAFTNGFSNPWIVSMIPGDLTVAGCLISFKDRGVKWEIL